MSLFLKNFEGSKVQPHPVISGERAKQLDLDSPSTSGTHEFERKNRGGHWWWFRYVEAAVTCSFAKKTQRYRFWFRLGIGRTSCLEFAKEGAKLAVGTYSSHVHWFLDISDNPSECLPDQQIIFLLPNLFQLILTRRMPKKQLPWYNRSTVRVFSRSLSLSFDLPFCSNDRTTINHCWS